MEIFLGKPNQAVVEWCKNHVKKLTKFTMLDGEIIELDIVGEYPNPEEKGNVDERSVKSIEFGSNISAIKSYMRHYCSFDNLDSIVVTSPNTIIEPEAFALSRQSFEVHNLTLPLKKDEIMSNIEKFIGPAATYGEKGDLQTFVDIGYQIIINCTDGSIRAVVNDHYEWEKTSI